MRSIFPLGLMCLALLVADDKSKTSSRARPVRRLKPIARVYAPDGGVFLSPADSKAEPRASRPSEALRLGDRVELKEKGAAKIVCFSGKSFRVKTGRSATLKADRLEPPDAVEPLADASKNLTGVLKDLPFDETYGAAILRGGEHHPAAVSPIDGSLIETDSPSLSWPQTPGAKSYRVRVSLAGDNDFKQPILTQDVPSAHLDWPKSAKPLSRGDVFAWTVHSVSGTDETLICRGRFTVSSAETASCLASARLLLSGDDPSDLLIAADLFRSVNAADLARSAYAKLASLFPDNADYRKILGDYDRLAGIKVDK
ncbi:MAG: hypothetical protein NVSMB14_06420 [Isosphaeraceae bacterium]